MKCKRHPHELGVGVCASCLRERLLALIAAEGGRTSELRRNVGPQPLHAFPRSVCPYVSHRRSIGSGPSPSHYPRPFSTPLVGSAAKLERIEAIGYDRSSSKKFSILSALFGYSRSDDVKSSKSGSWISDLFSGRRKNKSDQRRSQPRISKSFQDRGMSPVRNKEGGGGDDSACSSGYSTESSTVRRRPDPTPVRKFASSSWTHSRGVSGLAVCLSPLVWPSPKPAAELGIHGDPRGGFSHRHHHRRHVSAGAATLAPCGSRKLADHGRFR